MKQQPGKDRLTAGNWHVGISRQPGALPARLPPVTVIGDWREAGVFEQVEAHRTTSTVVDAGAVSTGASLLWITPARSQRHDSRLIRDESGTLIGQRRLGRLTVDA